MGRFAQADTIIPIESQGVQAWDRYAYVNNNPVRYTDPSGHCVICIGLVLVGAFFIFNGASDSYQPNLSNTELESRQTSVAIGTSLILSGLSIKSPLVELISNGLDCASGYCDPNLMIPGSVAAYSEVVDNVAPSPSTTTGLATYDPYFAAQQLIDGARIPVSSLNAMIPASAPNTFIPSSTIPDGYKHEFDVNGTPIELKWHAPDINAYNLYGPSSNSGTMWTAQIKVDGLLLGVDRRFYRKQQGNLTHIPVAIPE